MCASTSWWVKLALFILIVGVALHIAGWSTNNWMIYETANSVIEINVGLWRQKSCSAGTCTEESVASTYETDSFNAVRGLETVTFCLAVFTLILLIIYMCADFARKQTMAAVIMVLLYIAGICSFVGMLVFIIEIPSPFVASWSLGLTIIAMTLIFIAGTLMIPDAFEPNYDSDSDDDDDDYFKTDRRRAHSPPNAITGTGIRAIEPPTRFRNY